MCQANNPCLNEGTCSRGEGNNDFKCTCPTGYGGTLCECNDGELISSTSSRWALHTVFSSHFMCVFMCVCVCVHVFSTVLMLFTKRIELLLVQLVNIFM